jgi:hypothetical protein
MRESMKKSFYIVLGGFFGGMAAEWYSKYSNNPLMLIFLIFGSVVIVSLGAYGYKKVDKLAFKRIDNK